MMQALVGSGVGHWLGMALDGSTRPLMDGPCLWSATTALRTWTLVQRALR